ncbi:MAG: hypothetical protein F6K19_13315 [Cyanothece sp. SIO1E1]|nr:hypothetical protein [Cyanothece sp. SIO1E1]
MAVYPPLTKIKMMRGRGEYKLTPNQAAKQCIQMIEKGKIGIGSNYDLEERLIGENRESILKCFLNL